MPSINVSQKELMVFWKQCSIMLINGIGLLRAISIIAEQEQNQHLKKALYSILDAISSGYNLSRAMSSHTEIFPQVHISLIQISERTGTLSQVMEQLADFEERNYNLKLHFKQALTYPAVIFVFSVALLILFFKCVLPSLLNNILSVSKTDFLPTKILLWLNDITGKPLFFILFFIFCGCIYYLVFIIKTRHKKLLDRYILKMPVIGPLILRYYIIQYIYILQIMISSGVSFKEVLDLLCNYSENLYLQKKLINFTRPAVINGESFPDAFACAKIFPKTFISMLEIGIQSAKIEELLNLYSKIIRWETEYTLERYLNMIEPVILLCMGIFISFVIIAVLYPLYNGIMTFN